MREYIGVDLHKRSTTVVKRDRRGKVVEVVEMPTRREELEGYFSRQDKRSRVVVEATGNWMYFYEAIEAHMPGVVLAHPLKTRAIAGARVKTDTLDAGTLAELLRLDAVASAYIPPREIRDLREVLRYRASLVSLRVSVKNRIHALLTKNGLLCPFTNVLGVKSRQWLQSLSLRPCYQGALAGYRRLGEIERFPDAKHLCSYAGLTPSVYSSGGKTRYGAITRQGSKWLRWILVEVSTHAANGDARFQKLYRKVRERKGTGTARVAVARAVLSVLYAMLKRKEPFRGVRPRRRLLASPWTKRRDQAVSGHPPGVMVQT